MHWLRRLSPLLIFALVSFFYCSQVCVAAGHMHVAVSALNPKSDSADATPCHSHSTAPQNTGDQCSDCGAHFLLMSTPSSVDALTAAGTVFSAVCFFALAIFSLDAFPLAYHNKFELHALLLPRYLAFSVLRL